jgi:two-component system chemotaxis response regulator CheY
MEPNIASNPACEKLRVIIVDDSIMMRNILMSYLRDYGIKDIKYAADGESALSEIASARSIGLPFNIVFLDWNMPGATGYDVLTNCRSDKSNDNTAIVMVTAENKQRNVLEAIKAGATAYMIKPISKTELDSKFPQILTWLSKAR